jgi:hypothetical protein
MEKYSLSILRLLGSYVVGIVVGNLIFLPYAGGWAFIFIVFGLIYCLPFLLIAMIVLLILHRSIQRHLLVWCISAPIIILIVWLYSEYMTTYAPRNFSVERYLTTQNVIERAVLAFTCATVASVSFFVWERRSVN